MTIEQRFEFFGMRVPGMRREMAPGQKGGLGFHWETPFKLVPESRVVVRDADTVVIEFFNSSETVTLVGEDVNKTKIKSPMMLASGLRTVYRWKQTKVEES